MTIKSNFLKLFFAFIFCISMTVSCQNKKDNSKKASSTLPVWIDMNEDENYTARHECSFVQAGDKFIMFGGRESAQKLDQYDFKSNSWSVAKSSAPKQFNHFQATFHKGFVWVIGSFKTNKFPREIPEDNIWLYHPPTDTWIQGPEIPEGRRRGGAGLVVYKDKFYLIGGNTIGHDGGFVNWFDEYDPEKNTWTILENASQARDHFSAAVIGHTLYAVGGRHSGGEGGVFAPLIGIVDTYNFDTKKWSTLSEELPTPRAAPGVAVFNNELLVMGGEGEIQGPAYKVVEAYNPNTKTWSKKTDMHHARHGTQAIVSGNGIYIAAGSPNRGGGSQHNMEVYNEDSAEGIPITSSNLETPETTFINSGIPKNIIVKNTGGNSGTFISNVKITGTHADKFEIKSNVDLTLIDANSELHIEISHIGNSNDAAEVIQLETANLHIIYNGTIEKTIKLISK
jgi:N-acetylneuraminic acid mutarotase